MEAPDKDMQDLIRRAKAGDKEAFDLLTKEHRPRLKHSLEKWTRFQLGPRIDIEDVLQTSLMNAFKSLPQFSHDGKDAFLRWLCGIAKHVLSKMARDMRRQGAQNQAGSEVKRVEDSGLSQSVLMRREERFKRLEASLKGLPADQREVLMLSRIEGLTMKEIAERTGTTVSKVRYRLALGLSGLKAAFGETESFHLPDRRLELGDDCEQT